MKDKQTIIVIDWAKKKGSRSMKIDEQGAKLPDEIRVMIANNLLRNVRGNYEVEVRLSA